MVLIDPATVAVAWPRLVEASVGTLAVPTESLLSLSTCVPGAASVARIRYSPS